MTYNYYQQQPSNSYYQPKPEPILPWYTPQLVSLGFMLVWGVWQYRRLQRQQHPQPFQPKQATTQVPTNSVKHLEARLINLMNGDSQAAYRLVQLTQSRNPGKPLSWCWEKVIMDLERDRRG